MMHSNRRLSSRAAPLAEMVWRARHALPSSKSTCLAEGQARGAQRKGDPLFLHTHQRRHERRSARLFLATARVQTRPACVTLRRDRAYRTKGVRPEQSMESRSQKGAKRSTLVRAKRQEMEKLHIKVANGAREA